MSLTVTQNEGTMVITITSNPKSKCPILCQILGSLCGPVCFLSEYMRKQLPATQRPFRSVQIGVAIRNLVLGCFGLVFFLMVFPFNYSMTSYGGLFNTMMMLSVLQLCVVIAFFVMTVRSLSMKAKGAKLVEVSTSQSTGEIWPYSYPFVKSCNMTFAVTQDLKDKLTDIHTALGIEQIIVGVMNITVGCFGFGSSFLIGGVFLVVGIMSVLAVKFPSHRLLVILVFLNIVSAAMAVSAVVLYSLDLAMGNNFSCSEGSPYYSTDTDFLGNRVDSCLYYRDLSQMILGGLDIMMIVLSVLQLGVTISFCVLTGKILCNNTEDAETVVDPELKKTLPENTTASSA